MTRLESTAPIRTHAERPDAPPLAELGVSVVEELITLTLNHQPHEAGLLAESVLKNPRVANVTLCMAIAALAQVEQAMQAAASTLEGLEADSPEAMEAINAQLARQYGD